MTIKQTGGIFGRNPTFGNLDVDAVTTDSLNISTVGGMGLFSGSLLYAGAGDTTLLFSSGGDAILPRGSAGAARDNAVDLGNATNRWKDIYLAGDVVIRSGNGIDFSATSGTGTSELFDDYEEGSWTPTLTSMGSSTVSSAVYTKIGRTVHIIVAIASDGSITANSSRFTLPYTSARLSSGVATRGTSEGGFVEIQAGTLCYFASAISTSGGVYVTATYEAA